MSKTFALVVGILFTVLGILGFILVPHPGMLFGVFAVNRTHDLIHLVVGLLGIGAALSRSSRAYCFALGVLFLAIGILGFIPSLIDSEGMLLSRVHINLADNILHLAVGGLSVIFGLVTSQTASAVPGGEPTKA